MAARTQVSQLILSLLDRVTGPSRTISGALDRLNAASRRNAAALDRMRGQMVDAAGMGFALAASLKAPIAASIAFESTMADIKKVVDFESPKAFAQMGRDIRAMSLRIPLTADAIGELIAAAGQSGIARNELAKFAEIAATVSTAWDTSAGDTSEALAKLKTAMGLTLDETASLADAINHLSNNGASAAVDVLDVVKRVGPMGKQFGLTGEQIAALGSAMTGAGFQSDVAATSILKVGGALTRGAGATARVQKAFKALGLSSKRVAVDMQRDAVGTIQKVLAEINKVPAAQRAAVITDLFGEEARALGPLISNGNLLADTMALISDKTKYAGSAQAEFQTRSKTTANALQLFRNRLHDLAISIGDGLLPGLNMLLDKLGPIITGVSDLAAQYPNLTAAVVAATAALVAFRVAAVAARFAGLNIMSGWIAGGLSLTKIAAGFARFGAFLAPVGAALAAISAPLWAAIAAGAALVAVAGVALWKYWDRVSATMSGVASAIGEQLAPALAYLSPVLAPIGAGVSAIGDAASWVGQQFSYLGGILASVFDREILSDDQAADMEQSAYKATRRFLNVFKAGFKILGSLVSDTTASVWASVSSGSSQLVEWARAISASMTSAIGWIDLSGMFTWPSMPSFDLPAINTAGISAAFDRVVAWARALPGRLTSAIGWIDLSGMFTWPSMPSFDLPAINTAGISAAFDRVVAWARALPGRLTSAIGRIDLAGMFTWPSMPSFDLPAINTAGISAAFDRVVAWARALPGRLTSAIGRIDLAGMFTWPSMPSFDLPAINTAGISAAFDRVVAWARALSGRLTSAIGRIDLAGIVTWPALPDFSASIAAIRSAIGGAVRALLDGAPLFASAGMTLVQNFWKGLSAKFDELMAWLRNIPSRIIAAIGSIDLSNIISWPSPPAWWAKITGGAPASTTVAKPENPIAGARATGGPVTAGKTYQVNERGIELFTPDRSGVISPHAAYKAAMAGASAGRAKAAFTRTERPLSVLRPRIGPDIFAGDRPRIGGPEARKESAVASRPAVPTPVASVAPAQSKIINIDFRPTFNVTGSHDARRLASDTSRELAEQIRGAVEGSYND